MQQVLPFISTLCIAISAVMVAIGWRQILKRRIESHKKFMLTGALFAILFFTIYVCKTLFVGSTQFGGPESLKTAYLIFLLFHILLAASAAVFGIVTIYLALKGRFMKHKKIGRVTASIWFVASITGITVYTLLYVLYPGGESGGLIDAILGG